MGDQMLLEVVLGASRRLSFFWSKQTQCPRVVIGDIALIWVLSFRWQFKQGSWLSVVTKDPMALIVRGVNPGVLAILPIWPSYHHGHLIIPSFQLAHSSPLFSPVKKMCSQGWVTNPVDQIHTYVCPHLTITLCWCKQNTPLDNGFASVKTPIISL
jgi:hypothetical protein